MNPVADTKKHTPFLSFIKNPKFFGLLTLAFIVLVGLPITLYEVSQQQNNQQHASWFVNRTQHYYCNSALSVDLYTGQEVPDCSTGVNDTGSFKSSMIIKASSGSVGAYAVHWMWAQFWCPTAHEGGCGLNGTPTSGVDGLTGDNKAFVTAWSGLKSPVPPYSGLVCGTYQNDFGFYITDNSDSTKKPLCTIFTSSNLNVSTLINTNNNASWCTTTNDCAVPPTATPKPTNTPVPTIPPTVVPTDTPTPTVVPTDTPTATPTSAITPTPTIPPGVTPTPTPTTPPGTPVAPRNPVCNSLTADRSTSGYLPYSLTLTGSATATDAVINKAVFTFGDGSNQTLTQGGTLGTKNASVPVSHTYKQVGSFTASVIFYDQNNLSTAPTSNCQLTIKIVSPPPGQPGNSPAPQPTTQPIPSTGPGDEFATIGAIGALLVLIGGIFAFGL